MPEQVSIEEMPAITRTFGDAKYKELTEAVRKLVQDPKARDKSGLAEKCSQEDFSAMAQAVRNAAKSVGRRVIVLAKDGKLFVRDNGAFVALDPEKAAERAAKAKATREAKAKANGKASGATKATAKK